MHKIHSSSYLPCLPFSCPIAIAGPIDRRRWLNLAVSSDLLWTGNGPSKSTCVGESERSPGTAPHRTRSFPLLPSPRLCSHATHPADASELVRFAATFRTWILPRQLALLAGLDRRSGGRAKSHVDWSIGASTNGSPETTTPRTASVGARQASQGG